MKKVTVIFMLAVSLLVMAACQQSGGGLYFTSDRDGNTEIYQTVIGSGEEINITETGEDEFDAILSPDRQWIAFRVGDEESSSIDVLNLGSGSAPERYTVSRGSGSFFTPVWSNDSKRIAFAGDIGNKGARVFITEITESLPARLSDIEVTGVGDWSPDGESVVFSSETGSRLGIHVRNPDGVNQRQMTCAKDYDAVWSPDSKRLAFISEREGNPDIYVMERDAEDELCPNTKDSRKEVLRLSETDEAESDISWSPDSKQLLFVSERDGNKEIYVMESSGNKQSRLTFNEKSDYSPVWSPDGRTIAFVSELDGDPDIFTMDVNGQNQTRITNNDSADTDPQW
tara:strand:- start:103 stop:1128 length:1026 start_codon:yes stop_codon:yes gene_type:complete